MISIIDNNKIESNHKTRIQELINTSTEVLIASPFLMYDFNEFLEEIDLSNLKKISIVTTLKPGDIGQIKKVYSLVSFIDFFHMQEKNIDVNFYINNKLHGKVYLFKDENRIFSGIVTSANFTDSGLSRNHEWGLEIEESSVLKQFEDDVFNTKNLKSLDEESLISLMYKIDEYLDANPNNESDKIDLNLNSLIPEKLRFVAVDDKRYWLKPIGVSHSPVEDGRLFNSDIGRLDFSKRRPSGVKIGDFIISYAVGNGKILSMYEAVSKPFKATKEEIKRVSWRERWPWSIDGRNLTPNYGGKWWTENLYIGNLRDEYLKANSKHTITYNGGKSLGALNWGSDKLRLSVGFAEYIINKVQGLN